MFYQQCEHDNQNTASHPSYYGSSNFLFNRVSGLYEPQSYAAAKDGQQRAPGASNQYPLFVRALTDWLVFAVSFLTLLLLGGTVYYAGHQWEEMVRAADGTIRSANAAWANSEIASEALDDSRESFDATLQQMEAQSW